MEKISTKQLYNLKARETEKKMGKAKVDLSEFMEWCDSNKAVPSNSDESFVLANDYKLDEKKKIKHLRVIITTPRLLQLAFYSKF